MNRGGARQGAGRKSKGNSPRVQLSILIDKELKDYIQVKSKESGISNSDMMEKIMLFYIDNH